MRVRTMALVISMMTLTLGSSALARAQAGPKTTNGLDPDQAAVHDYVLTVDKCERYAAAAKKLDALQQHPPDPATAAEMQKIQEANVYNVQKADMMEKSPHVASIFKTLNITPRDYVLVPLTLTLTSSLIESAGNPKLQAEFSYITPAQIQFVKDHQADLEKWGLK